MMGTLLPAKSSNAKKFSNYLFYLIHINGTQIVRNRHTASLTMLPFAWAYYATQISFTAKNYFNPYPDTIAVILSYSEGIQSTIMLLLRHDLPAYHTHRNNTSRGFKKKTYMSIRKLGRYVCVVLSREFVYSGRLTTNSMLLSYIYLW